MIKIFTTIWALCLSIGLFAQENQRMFFAYDASNGLADNSAQIVLCTKTGRLVISTIGHINFYDGASFTHVDPSPGDAKVLPGYDGRYQMYFDSFHHLWIKHHRQLTCVDLLKERFISNIDSVLVALGTSKHLDDLYGDGESNVWFRTGDMVGCPSLKKQFRLHHKSSVQDLDLYNDSLILMFHQDGAVSVYDYQHGNYKYTDDAFDGREKQRFIQSSELCLVGNRYYHLHNGEHAAVLLCYDIDQRKWTKLLESPFLMNALYPIGDKIYIGTERGYIVYNYVTGNVEHVETLNLTKGRRQHANISSLCFDRQGGMWIGTARRGLLYCKPFNSPFNVYSAESHEGQHYVDLLNRKSKPVTQLEPAVNCILKDSRGWTWKGLFSGLLLEKPNGKKQMFTNADGLPNQVIHSIIEDDNHDIWVSTSFGIVHVFIRNSGIYHIEAYINQDNIPSESFLNGRAVKLEDGTIVMQSIDHVVTFRPDQFHAKELSQMVLYPKLTRLTVNGSNIGADTKLDGRILLDRSVSRMREITVNYNQNSLSMTFTGLNYLRPVQTYYRIRVKGVPAYDEWRVFSYGKSDGMVDKNGLLRLPLLALRPGTYRVEVQCSLWPDVWNQDPFVWIVNVNQPWWRTTGIYGILGVLVMIALLLNFWMFNRNTRFRLLCTNEENHLLHRIKSYASRCQLHYDEIINLHSDFAHDVDNSASLYSKFVDAMLRIIPYIRQHQGESFNLRDLISLTEMKSDEFYEVIASNLDTNPRLLIRLLRLEEARQLLCNTTLSISEIADRCRFASPNYFISSFYHYFRITPQGYRNNMLR